MVSTNPAALAKQCASVASYPGPSAAERDDHVLEEDEIPDIVVEESEEEERGWSSGYPSEQLEEVQIRCEDPTKTVKVGEGLDPGVKVDLRELLREYNDIFAWSHEDMPGIPLSLATHRLAVDATFKPVKQKRRHFNAERNAAVQEEVDKLLKAGFIRESRYPE